MASITAAPEPGNTPPRVELSVDASDLGPVPTEVTVSRVDPDGRARVVRGAGPAQLSGGLWVGFDYEAPFGDLCRYRFTVAATTYESGLVTLDVDDVWLRHPGSPSLSTPVRLHGDSLRSAVTPIRQGVFRPLRRQLAVVVTDGRRGGVESALTVRTVTLEQLAALHAALADGSPLLLSVPGGSRWGLTNRWIAVADVNEIRFDTEAADENRLVELPFIEVDPPVGDVQAQWTWASVLAEYTSWAEVAAVYDSWLDVVTGPAE